MSDFVDFIAGFLMVAFMIFLIAGYHNQKYKERKNEKDEQN